MFKKFLFSIISLFLFIITPIFAVNYPSPSGFVNDFADLYSSDFKAKLEENLSNFEKDTSSEIAVVTVKSLEGLDIETYAVELYEKWKIGKKGEDDGLLLLIAKEDREIRIEVGYGLEPYITDGRAGEIIRKLISPEFKKENYEAGTLAAVEQLEKYISSKDIAPKEVGGKGKDDSGGIIIFFLAIFFIASIYLASFLGRTKVIWPGGLIGGVVGIIVGIIVGSIFVSAFIGIFGGLFGLILDAILSKNYKVRKEKGLPTGFFHTWGGFSGGGKSGGEGFGGFGGGSSGGGGASGGW